jgi:hypothetical protein
MAGKPPPLAYRHMAPEKRPTKTIPHKEENFPEEQKCHG